MHQVLSYEAALRAAHSSREYRQCVTKRTCTTLIFIISLFALLSGYILGIFITDRRHQMRQLTTKNPMQNNEYNEVAFTSADYAQLKKLRIYEKTKEQLLASARKLSKTLQQEESFLSTSLNTDFFNKYISCAQDIPPNTSMESSQFIEQLLDNTAARQQDCMHIIQVVIDKHLANG